MPTKRRRKSRQRLADVTADQWAILTDEEPTDPAEGFFLRHPYHPEALRELWLRCRERILADWITTKGGTRPSLWWKFDAPRLATIPERFAGLFFAAEMIEPRLVLRGAGRPSWEVLSVVPHYRLGVPGSWVDTDGDDPLVFETQYDYLRRHGLLAPGEDHVADI